MAHPTDPIYRLFDTLLWSHPRNVCMSYWQHFNLSMHFAVRFFIAGICALLHAMVPCMFETHTSDTIRWATRRINTAGCHGK